MNDMSSNKDSNKERTDLSKYNLHANEPNPSVIESSDYEFAVFRYDSNDFRYSFIESFVSILRANTSFVITNVKICRPRLDSNFLNCYIYIGENNTYSSFERIEDNDDIIAKSFHSARELEELPGTSSDTRIQLIIRDYTLIIKSHMLKQAWNRVHNEVPNNFEEVSYMCFWGNYYIFFRHDDYSKVIKDNDYLLRLKDFCYALVHDIDEDDCILYEHFNILIDDYSNYASVGGQHYFNSDLMGNVIKI